jgi:hypothetical protein
MMRLLMRLTTAAVLAVARADERCSLNGRYLGPRGRAGGRCVCDRAWEGEQCELLALLPVPSGSDYDTRASTGLSTWGASIVQLPRDPTWHMYASEFLEGCGVTSWQTNSQCVAPKSSISSFCTLGTLSRPPARGAAVAGLSTQWGRAQRALGAAKAWRYTPGTTAERSLLLRTAP